MNMSVVPQKQEAVYVRGVVIAPNLEDTQGDTTPDKEGIKRIFTNYLEHETDIQHSFIKNFQVHQLENTITTEETTINGQTVPVGSWIASHMVLNKSISAMINNNQLNGYSLGALGDKALNENRFQDLNPLMKGDLLMYNDLSNLETLNPFFISFVDKPSNGFTWEVMNYDSFLAKSTLTDEVTGDTMTEEKNIVDKPDEEMVKVSVVERLLKPFILMKSADAKQTAEEEKEEEEEVEEEVKAEEKAETDVEAKTETETSEAEAEAEADESSNVTLESISEQLKEQPKMVAKAVVEGLMQFAQNQQEAASVAAKSDDAETLETDITEDSTVQNQVMAKSSTKLDEVPKPSTVKPADDPFIGGTKRDEFGRVRKYV